MADPVRELVHSHATLSREAMELRALVRVDAEVNGEQVARKLESLRDELLHHFADEEEGLFPFVRRCVPDRAALVDRLAAAHDAICKTIVALVQRAQRPRDGSGDIWPSLSTLYTAFEDVYAEHSADESALFDDLLGRLDEGQRAELATILKQL